MSTTVEEIEKKETGEKKKDELLLDSLEIKGYRCFEHLTIEKLGRVNLIVGKNNVGKTALLEALWIYTSPQTISTLAEITLDRNERLEKKLKPNDSYGLKSSEYFSVYRHLFNNRPTSNKKGEHYTSTIEIGVLNNVHKKVSVTLENPGMSPIIRADHLWNRFSPPNYHFIKTTKTKPIKLLELWRNIELRVSEEFVTSALKIITDKIISARLTEYPEIDSPKTPIARIKDIDEPVPLASLGEGMNRMFTIAVALANCKNGILLIDEVESGLHYSVLPDVWKLIFKTAKDLNVQVFATTHSKDCIEAFTQAAVDSPEDGELIRLERHGEKIVAKTIDEDRLAQAINHDVEVR